MVGTITLSPNVEKLIKDDEVLRVLRLFIALGRTDIVEFLNKTVNKDTEEVQETLQTLHYFVKRGLRTQRYLTSQMRRGTEPSEWPYDLTEEKSFSSAERDLVHKYKFGARWPTVRGAIDVFRRGILNCVDKTAWVDPATGLTYRAWTTVNVCPPDRRLWKTDSEAYRSQRYCAYSRLQFIVFYPGLVNLAFLEQGQADVLGRAEAHFDAQWARDGRFRETSVDVTRRVLERYGSVDDGYTNYDGLLTKEALSSMRKRILADFDAQRDAMLGAGVKNFHEFSHAGWWYKYGSFWSPGNSIGSILHSNKMLTENKFRAYCNTVNDSKEIRTKVAMRAVSRFGYTPPADGYSSSSLSSSSLSRSSTSSSTSSSSTNQKGSEKPKKNKNSPKDTESKASTETKENGKGKEKEKEKVKANEKASATDQDKHQGQRVKPHLRQNSAASPSTTENHNRTINSGTGHQKRRHRSREQNEPKGPKQQPSPPPRKPVTQTVSTSTSSQVTSSRKISSPPRASSRPRTDKERDRR